MRQESCAPFMHELSANDPAPFAKLFLMVDQIPMNVSARCLGDLLKLLGRPSVVPLIQLPSARILDRVPQPLGAAGYGLALRGDEGGPLTQMIAEIMTRFAGDRGAFAWLSRLNTPAMLDAAKEAGVRVATGAALCLEHFEGLGEVPKQPLRTPLLPLS